jgi:dihydropteroate synthase
MTWGTPIAVAKPRPWRAGSVILGGGAPLLMGILNVTPDSFFDGGRHAGVDAALRHADALLNAGADILDVGGESTRPGADPVPEAEELARTRPVVEALWKRFRAPISIDTMKSTVARAALEAGASIINDISAMEHDPLMLEVPQAFGAGVALNHMRGTPKDMQNAPAYGDVVAEVRAYLLGRVQLLAAMGVPAERIAVDPGIGFGKRPRDNYALLEHLEALHDIGCPILVGASRKSFISKTQGLEASDRLIPSVAVALYAALKGASILRVHDVAETREAMAMVGAIRGAAPG